MTEKKNSVVIREAKEVLRVEGWTQGTMGVSGQAHCVLGAFREAVYGRDTWVGDYPWAESVVLNRIPAAKAMERCILSDMNKDGYPEYVDIVDWNDANNRTVEEILARMEQCAQAEEAAGR